MTASIFDSICPDCQHLVAFASANTNFIQCPFCKVVLERSEFGRLSTKPLMLVQYKTGLLQQGAEGVWENKKFIVLGRIMAFEEELAYSYWTIRFANDEIALLGEGYGTYSILKLTKGIEPDLRFQKVNTMKAGQTVTCNGKSDHFISAKFKCSRWEMEGELWIPLLDNQFYCIDLLSETSEDYVVFINQKDAKVCFTLQPAAWRDLQLTNLRTNPLPGKQFSCPKCNTRLTLKTFPYGNSGVCKTCNTAYTFEDGLNLKKLMKLEEPDGISIPLGCFGEVDGVRYEVIGFALKEEANSYQARWKEYSLYSPSHGFAFLSEFEGHWIFLKEREFLKFRPADGKKEIYLFNEYYQVYNDYSSKVIAAAGEFPTNIFNDRNTQSREFISPPEIWIYEKNGKESFTWFHGRHISTSELSGAFPDLIYLPVKKGVGAVQPVGTINIYKLIVVSLVGILFLLLMHLMIASSKNKAVVFEQDLYFPDSLNQVTQVSEAFHLPDYSGNMAIALSAPLDNSWASVNASLVSTTNGKEYSVEKGIEYYHGITDGESWSEGDMAEEVFLTEIPRGDYQLQLTAFRDESALKVQAIHVKATYNEPSTRNLVITILLSLIWPVAMFLYSNTKEKERWSNSPFSTFNDD